MDKPNPFVTISSQWRYLVVLVVCVYQLFVPGLRGLLYPGDTPLFLERLLADLIYTCLLFLPLFFYRSEYGWLHPLIFGSMYDLAKWFVTKPEQLFAPLTIFYGGIDRPLQHAALTGWSQDAIAAAMLKAQLVMILALLAYYLGYFRGPRFGAPRLRFAVVEHVNLKALALVAVAAVLFFAFLQAQGGLAAHFSSFGGGRFRALAGTGHIHVLVGLGMTAVLIWWAFDSRAGRNPLFWASAAFAVPSTFFLSGSRSSVVGAVVLLVLIWTIRNRTVPPVKVLVVGVLAVMLIGSLGSLRRSTLKGQVDWTVLTESSMIEWIAAGRGEIDRRAANSGYLAVIAKVPGEADLLYGAPYVGTLLFFVPRAIWEAKPRGIGSMVNAHLFRGLPMDDQRFHGGGIPASPVGEAYWNFHLPGVVIVFLLFGMFHRWLAAVFRQYPYSPAVAVLYVITLTSLAPSGTSIINWLQIVVPATIILWGLGAIRMGRAGDSGRDRSRPWEMSAALSD